LSVISPAPKLTARLRVTVRDRDKVRVGVRVRIRVSVRSRLMGSVSVNDDIPVRMNWRTTTELKSRASTIWRLVTEETFGIYGHWAYRYCIGLLMMITKMTW